MTEQEIAYLSDLNLAESIREMARWNASNEIYECNDLLLTRGADESPIVNVAIRLDLEKKNPGSEFFRRVKSYYSNYRAGFSIHLRNHGDVDLEAECRSDGMHLIASPPGMMISERIPEKQLPSGIGLAVVEKKAMAEEFAAVAIESYKSLGMPEKAGKIIFQSPERCIRPYNHIVVAYIGKKPVSCAMAIFSHMIAGVYWVGTIPEARNRGLAEVCTRACTNEAFQRGARFVVLQASKFGEPIYRRMGFRETTGYLWYMQFKS
jgi:hypothetical protein